MNKISRAVILMNLGSPARPEPSAIRTFLREFLSDRRVVELPRLLWLPLLHGIILPFRARRLAGLYQEIWTENGSPLTAITCRQVRLLDELLQADGGDGVLVSHAMTYGGPSLQDRVTALRAEGVEHFLIVPLYPQYSATTTGPVYDQVAKLFTAQRHVPDIRVIRQYCERQDYIAALAGSVRQHWQLHGQSKVLLFSFHGIPQRCVDLGDPYYQQCHDTAAAVATSLGLVNEQWRVSFQSRFGRAQWVQPYTDDVLGGFPAAGIDSVDVICPAFAADCLETLEEIEVQSREYFIRAGGKCYSRIACLNDEVAHIRMLHSIAREHFA